MFTLSCSFQTAFPLESVRGAAGRQTESSRFGKIAVPGIFLSSAVQQLREADSEWLNKKKKKQRLTIRRKPATTNPTENGGSGGGKDGSGCFSDRSTLAVIFLIFKRYSWYSIVIEAATAASHCDNKTAFHYQHNMWLRQRFKYKKPVWMQPWVDKKCSQMYGWILRQNGRHVVQGDNLSFWVSVRFLVIWLWISKKNWQFTTTHEQYCDIDRRFDI